METNCGSPRTRIKPVIGSESRGSTSTMKETADAGAATMADATDILGSGRCANRIGGLLSVAVDFGPPNPGARPANSPKARLAANTIVAKLMGRELPPPGQLHTTPLLGIFGRPNRCPD